MHSICAKVQHVAFTKLTGAITWSQQAYGTDDIQKSSKSIYSLEEELKSTWKSESKKYENRFQIQKIIAYSLRDFSDSISKNLIAI